jgi:hypothetical protein
MAYSLLQILEATCFSEMSVDFHRTTWRYIPEDENFITSNITYEILFSPMHATCSAYIILLDFIIPIILDEEFKL